MTRSKWSLFVFCFHTRLHFTLLLLHDFYSLHFDPTLFTFLPQLLFRRGGHAQTLPSWVSVCKANISRLIKVTHFRTGKENFVLSTFTNITVIFKCCMWVSCIENCFYSAYSFLLSPAMNDKHGLGLNSKDTGTWVTYLFVCLHYKHSRDRFHESIQASSNFYQLFLWLWRSLLWVTIEGLSISIE